MTMLYNGMELPDISGLNSNDYGRKLIFQDGSERIFLMFCNAIVHVEYKISDLTPTAEDWRQVFMLTYQDADNLMAVDFSGYGVVEESDGIVGVTLPALLADFEIATIYEEFEGLKPGTYMELAVGYAEIINVVPEGGGFYFFFRTDIGVDHSAEDGLIEGTLTEYTNDRVTEVRSYAFYNNTSLQSVSLPNVTNVGDAAFSGCTGLQSVELPEATTVGSIIFSGCTGLKKVDLSKLRGAGSYVFRNCTALESADLPNLEVLRYATFINCTSLTTVNLPSLTHMSDAESLAGCTALTTLDLPAIQQMGGPRVLSGATAFKSLILRSSTLCTIGASTFDGSTIESGTGYVYVPAALLEKYKANTNWSTYAAQLRALEDYTVDGTTTGALDESKI